MAAKSAKQIFQEAAAKTKASLKERLLRLSENTAQTKARLESQRLEAQRLAAERLE